MRKFLSSSAVSALLALVFAIATVTGSLTAYAEQCNAVRNQVLRLHVIANSDSCEDQQVKLLVRDRLLAVGTELFGNARTLAQATALVQATRDILQQQAQEVLAENGLSYAARVEIRKEYFETRTYGNTTLPAGIYLAVRVVLGEGQGQNWWCVMFPPLCLPAATQTQSRDAFVDNNKAVTEAADGYEIRFKIVELVEELRQYFREKREE